MRSSSDEPDLLQEAMQCTNTCEVVSSKTYVKKKHDTFYKKLPWQLHKTSKAMQCLFGGECSSWSWSKNRPHPSSALERSGSVPLPIRVEERETSEASAESYGGKLLCAMRLGAMRHLFHSLGCCACRSSSGHAAPGGCKAMQPKASLKVARAKRCLSWLGSL